MRLLIAAVGRLKAGPERDLAARYRERAAQLGRSLGFPACDTVEIPESRARRPQDRCAEEGTAILAHAQRFSTETFAETMQAIAAELVPGLEVGAPE